MFFVISSRLLAELMLSFDMSVSLVCVFIREFDPLVRNRCLSDGKRSKRKRKSRTKKVHSIVVQILKYDVKCIFKLGLMIRMEDYAGSEKRKSTFERVIVR